MQDVAHDVLAVSPSDLSAGEEIGNIDRESGQSGAAGISKEVLVHSLHFRDFSCGKSFHHWAKVVFVDRPPFVADVKDLTGGLLLEFRFLISSDDSLNNCGVVAIIARAWNKVAGNQARAKIGVLRKPLLAGVYRAAHVSAVNDSPFDRRGESSRIDEHRKVHESFVSNRSSLAI
jgi:hypothetical protein